MKKCGVVVGLLLMAGCVGLQEKTAEPAKPKVSMAVATAWAKGGTGVDAFAAGRYAAESLKTKLNGVEPHVVILTECFAEKADKAKVAKGVASVFGKDKVVGISAFGFYTRDGVADRNAVALLALGGDDIAVRTAFVPKQNSTGLTMENDEPALKAALASAGRQLAAQLPVTDRSRLMIVLADTHSPKNQLLLDGIQEVIGTQFPVTGGSANKNAGMNFIHWRGGLHADAAVALMIDGNVSLAQNGAQARDNQAVLDTAKKVASDVREASSREVRLSSYSVPIRNQTQPLFLAFDCAGRKGKLEAIEEEQAAILAGLATPQVGGHQTPFAGEVFGMWCAGEFGRPEDSLDKPVGRGWHIMGTLIGWGRPNTSGIIRAANPVIVPRPVEE